MIGAGCTEGHRGPRQPAPRPQNVRYRSPGAPERRMPSPDSRLRETESETTTHSEGQANAPAPCRVSLLTGGSDGDRFSALRTFTTGPFAFPSPTFAMSSRLLGSRFPLGRRTALLPATISESVSSRRWRRLPSVILVAHAASAHSPTNSASVMRPCAPRYAESSRTYAV